jgi:hypothetical protein
MTVTIGSLTDAVGPWHPLSYALEKQENYVSKLGKTARDWHSSSGTSMIAGMEL